MTVADRRNARGPDSPRALLCVSSRRVRGHERSRHPAGADGAAHCWARQRGPGEQSGSACGWRVLACAAGATRAPACVQRGGREGRWAVPRVCRGQRGRQWLAEAGLHPHPGREPPPSPPRWPLGGGGVAPSECAGLRPSAPGRFQPLRPPSPTRAKTTLDKELNAGSAESVFSF